MIERRPKQCSGCQMPVSIHVTKVVNGKAVKLGLCASCPKAEQAKLGQSWDLVGEEDGGAQPSLKREDDQKTCPSCGLKPSDFKDSGRLGCPTCYEAFAEKLEPLIRKLHRGESHLGKAPQGRKRVVSQEEIAALKRRLSEHVSREEYELAAVVRDQITQLGG